MSTIIEYRNFYSNPITEQEAQELSDYEMAYYENDTLKKVEHFENRKLDFIDYYKSPDESNSDILNLFSSQKEIHIVEKTQYGKYTIEDDKCYINSVFDSHERTLFDQFKNIVCEQEMNKATGEPYVNTTHKYFYIPGKESEGVEFTFSYNDKGNIIRVEDYSPYSGIFHSIRLEVFNIRFPDFLASNPYYNDAAFLPWLTTG